jgi:ethylbenzene dioxygenase beta subunit
VEGGNVSGFVPALDKAVIEEFLGESEREVVPDDRFVSVMRFLTSEARMLDEENYREWLALFTRDARYWMPVMENRYRKDSQVRGFAPDRMSFFDDDLETLKLRVKRLDSGAAWPEDPPVRHVYAISNIEAFATARPDRVIAHSVFVSYRNKLDRDDATLIGRRRDLLEQADDGWRIRRRLVLASQSLLLSKNLNIFF